MRIPDLLLQNLPDYSPESQEILMILIMFDHLDGFKKNHHVKYFYGNVIHPHAPLENDDSIRQTHRMDAHVFFGVSFGGINLQSSLDELIGGWEPYPSTTDHVDHVDSKPNIPNFNRTMACSKS